MKRLILFLSLLVLWPSLSVADNPYILAYKKVSSSSGGTVNYGSSYSEAQSSAAVTSIDIAVPSGMSNGNVVIATVASDEDQAITLPDANWTLIAQTTSSSHRQILAYKVVNGDSGNYTFSVSTSTGMCGAVSYFTKTGGTWDVTTYTTNTVASGTTITSTSIDVTAGSVLYLGGSSDGAYATSDLPADMTKISIQYGSPSVGTAEYYQEYSAATTGVTKTITWNADEQHAVAALVIKAN